MDKQKNTYLSLLRGINVGGNNIIKMVDLKACFETMGVTDVKTYIQSGNVLFTYDDSDVESLTCIIEDALSKTFKKQIKVVTVAYKKLKDAVTKAPPKFGSAPETYRYDVIFLKKPLTAKEAIKSIVIKEGVDEVYAGHDVLYFSRLTEKVTQSKLSRIISLPIYQSMTIRNWNTTTKLLALIENKIL